MGRWDATSGKDEHAIPIRQPVEDGPIALQLQGHRRQFFSVVQYQYQHVILLPPGVKASGDQAGSGIKSTSEMSRSSFQNMESSYFLRNQERKKADVTEHPQVFDHVGLLFNEPLGTAGLLSI